MIADDIDSASAATLPILRRGASGPAVFALREHLHRLGHRFGGERDFGERTEQAVRTFQTTRRLRADGICGPQTWSALHDSGYALGDRILALRKSMLRGDDVASLQHRLSALGFDPGRPDGVFGPGTEAALREFQHNAGVANDGVCGPATITALDRLDALAGGSVVAVRERESLATKTRTVVLRRVALNGSGQAKDLFDRVADLLGAMGAEILRLLGDDDGATARAANEYGAELFVARQEPDEAGHRLSFFGTAGFGSVGGHHHATHLATSLAPILGECAIDARTYAVLRETKMAAVVLHLDDAEIARNADALAPAIADGIRAGFEAQAIALLG